jgi:hypothetical protein
MDELIRLSLCDMFSEGKEIQGEAFRFWMAEPERPVSWADEAWSEK